MIVSLFQNNVQQGISLLDNILHKHYLKMLIFFKLVIGT